TCTIRAISSVVFPAPADASTIRLSPSDSRMMRRASASERAGLWMGVIARDVGLAVLPASPLSCGLSSRAHKQESPPGGRLAAKTGGPTVLRQQGAKYSW